jgi:hypothetical protein
MIYAQSVLATLALILIERGKKTRVCSIAYLFEYMLSKAHENELINIKNKEK